MGREARTRDPLHLTLVRPNKLNLETGTARVVCDGKTLTVVTPLKKYTDSPALGDRDVLTTVFAGGPVRSTVFEVRQPDDAGPQHERARIPQGILDLGDPVESRRRPGTLVASHAGSSRSPPMAACRSSC